MSAVENMSRHEMLEWVNSVVHGQYKKIEELCSGVAYCQMMELLFPNSIGLKKVKIGAKLEHEYLHNLKLFQASFTRLKIEKAVPIDRLIKGRFQDNFEFLQWFQKFFDTHSAGKANLKVPAALAAAAANAPRPVRKLPMSAGVVSAKAKGRSQGELARSVSPGSQRVLQETKKQLAKQIRNTEYERNHFFKKLTDIEKLLNKSVEDNTKVEWCKRALDVLYASDYDDKPADTGSETAELILESLKNDPLLRIHIVSKKTKQKHC